MPRHSELLKDAKVLGIKFDQPTYDLLREAAEDHDRPMSAEARVAVREYLRLNGYGRHSG